MPVTLGRTVAETYINRIQSTPRDTGFQFRSSNGGSWKKISFLEFDQECRAIAYGLMSLGVQPGDKVAIVSSTRVEWAQLDIAIQGARGVSVPIYASTPEAEVAYLLNHSDSKWVIVENSAQLEKILAKWDTLSDLKKVIVMEPSAMALALKRPDVLTLDALKELGRREKSKDPEEFERNLKSISPSDVFTICYTSGTSGLPKGVILTHDNLVSVFEDLMKAFSGGIRPEKEVLLTYLPFSHVLGRVESLLTFVFGWRECYSQSIDSLYNDLLEIRPTVIISVPNVFERAFVRFQYLLDKQPPSKKKLIQWAFAVTRRIDSPQARRIVLRFFSNKFLGRLRFAISGGAPLSKEVGEFLETLGLRVFEGYGLTETAGPITVNTPSHHRLGTVGRPLAEVVIRTADDGEILVKSRKVFQGYYKMPEETKRVLKDDWFHTEDMGFIDQDGFLRITDRKKDLIVLSNGKKVPPQKVENLAKGQMYLHQLFALGDRKSHLTALITLDREKVIQYANEDQILFSEYDQLLKHSKILHLVQKTVDEINSHLAPFEAIRKFKLLPKEFSIEDGELTPSLKFRRRIIQAKYAADIEEMYPQATVDWNSKIR
ncbi:long-chain fatty acid--CoA ligase [bacterium]|nr:long-chain fatty acid--CoA ligase [bacterium]